MQNKFSKIIEVFIFVIVVSMIIPVTRVMVFKGSLYILNLLCGIVPCEYNYSYPDTSASSSELFVNYTTNEVHNLKENSTSNEYTRNFNTKSTDPLVVDTASGKIRGYWMRVVGGQRIRAFEGIPYAEPPLHERRFQAPVPVKPWEGIMEANLKGPKCLQYNDIIQSRVVGSENCLYLNIYCKEMDMSNNKTKQPVIVYIHGGGFLTGSGNDFGPSYLLQRDIILVTINYRLGAIGFFSTTDEASPGNNGLKDQAEAINFIYKNIKYFGGGDITLFGHGSGGASVQMQMMSFKARGKFIAGISVSGTAFNQWAMHTKEQALNLTKRFAKTMGCPAHGSTKSIVKCLKEIKGPDLVKAQIQFLDTWPVPLSLFRPVVEDEYQMDDPFLTEGPEEAYQKGTVDLIPWICGQAEDEGFSLTLSHRALGTFKRLRNNWNEIAPDFLNYNDLPVVQDEITRRINWLYFRRTDPRSASIKTFTDALGARLIQTGIHKALQAHSQHAETYAFMFGYKGQYNLGSAAGVMSTEWAVGHGEILGYILNSTNTYPGFKRNDPELVLTNILVNLIYNFARNQVPSFTTQSGKKFKVWNAIKDPRNMSFLHIDKKIKMIPEPYLKQTLYWESLGLPDSLPLANFSNEIQNVSDPLAKGFVSTDISITGNSVPDGLLPPPTLNENNYQFYSNNSTATNNSYSTVNLLFPSLIPPIAEIGLFTAKQNHSKLTTRTTEAPLHAIKPYRWIAQDFQAPSLIRTTGRPSSTSELTNSNRLKSINKNISQSQRGNQNIFSAFFNAFSKSQINDEKSLGISIPIMSEVTKSNFVTKSNIPKDYLNILGFNRINKNIIEASKSPNEIMIMTSDKNIATSAKNKYFKY